MITFIKLYFELGLYTTEQLKTFVIAQMITADDFKTLTGNPYEVA